MGSTCHFSLWIFCVCASSASVKDDNTDNEQEKRDEKGTSERENNELEAVSIYKYLCWFIYSLCTDLQGYRKKIRNESGEYCCFPVIIGSKWEMKRGHVLMSFSSMFCRRKFRKQVIMKMKKRKMMRMKMTWKLLKAQMSQILTLMKKVISVQYFVEFLVQTLSAILFICCFWFFEAAQIACCQPTVNNALWIVCPGNSLLLLMLKYIIYISLSIPILALKLKRSHRVLNNTFLL